MAAKRPDAAVTAESRPAVAGSAIRATGSGERPSRPCLPASYDISSAVQDGLASDRHFVFAGAMVFIVLLALGFVYDWRKGVFQWR